MVWFVYTSETDLRNGENFGRK